MHGRTRKQLHPENGTEGKFYRNGSSLPYNSKDDVPPNALSVRPYRRRKLIFLFVPHLAHPLTRAPTSSRGEAHHPYAYRRWQGLVLFVRTRPRSDLGSPFKLNKMAMQAIAITILR
jgi:hypothetical protein